MSTKREITIASIVAFAVALALIVGSTFVGILPSPFPSPSVQTGTLSILLTDPPIVPNGVTAIYITYFDLEVHVSNAGNQSGWIKMQNQGSLELMGTINVSQTLASAPIQSGVYNLLRFNISSAQVTYNGENYTAFIPSSRLLIPIIHGVEVNASQPSAAIIDITPTVINIGSMATPEFIIRPVAKAYSVPSSQVTEEMEHIGNMMSLKDKSWWKKITEESTTNLQIISASLAVNSLSISVKDTGKNTTLKLIVVSPLVDKIKEHGKNRMPAEMAGSAIFGIENNGSLVPIQRSIRTMMSDELERSEIFGLLGSAGYNIASGASANFTYTGQIRLDFRMGSQTSNIVSGQQYLVTVLGDDALASIVVVAT